MADKENIKVGIIAAPERAADITENIVGQLAEQFSKQVEYKTNWKVEWLVDPLTGAAETAQDILYNATYIKSNKEWDYAICLTDLPIFHKKNIVAADISFDYHVAQISIPAFGWAPMQKRIEKTMIQLLSELYGNDTVDQTTYYHSKTPEKHKRKSRPHLFKRQFPIKPIRRQENPGISIHKDSDSNEENASQKKNSNQTHDSSINVRYMVPPRLNGRLRLILGMTFANNPMKMMSSFKRVIAIAFSTGAFALIFPTIWNLGQIVSVYRLTGMMLAAIFGLVAWIIAAHHLWEYPSKQNKPTIRRLYNLATTSTLIINVVTYYTFMFILFLAACLIFIPIEYFQSMINDYDDIGPTFVNYMRVAWATASISTIVSAIGGGLENEELVRNITYGYRQNRRYEEVNRNNNR